MNQNGKGRVGNGHPENTGLSPNLGLDKNRPVLFNQPGAFFMPSRFLKPLAAICAGALLAIGLSACNSSSSGDDHAGGDGGAVATPTSVHGVAMAGPLAGQVCAHVATSSGVAGGAPIACVDTVPATGAFPAMNIPAEIKAIVLIATGSYVDEATGQTVTVGAGSPLRSHASWDVSGGSVSVAITPLTEAAIRSAVAAGGLNHDRFGASLHDLAQALGLDAGSGTAAIAELVNTLPAVGGDLDAQAHARLLAVLSRAQSNFCAGNAACSLDHYLDHVATYIGSGSVDWAPFRQAVEQALADWEAANPDDGVTCQFTGGKLTCALTGGGNGGGGNGGGAIPTGNWNLDIVVTASGVTAPAIRIENIPKPASQAEFCAAENMQGFQQTVEGFTGTWQITSCTFNGTVGNISAVLSITSPVNMTVPYSVVYTYTPR